METNKIENNFKKLIGKSLLEPPGRNFEDNVMGKVVFIHALKQKRNKNLKLSWIFLIISASLVPACYLTFLRYIDFEFLNRLGKNLYNSENIVSPAILLIFAIIILLQIDNLLRLTFRTSNI
ncbi:MAG: hypothetical protein JXB24_08250 [Bacteroidales bacterium]|nr:hypothetical protein [Bacteroidales bacterium]